MFSWVDTLEPFAHVESSFEDLLERAEIENFRFHDLRHTCILVHDEWR
jgi:hypothetical protein